MDPHLLSRLPEQERVRVEGLMVLRHYTRGQSIFTEGDLADCLHFVVEGHVIVRRTTPTGDRAAFTVMGPGEAFGELALLSSDARRTSSVAALDPTVTMVLQAQEFAALTREHPQVNQLLVEVLAARVARLSDHLLDGLYASVEARVGRRLADLCRIYGVEHGEVVLPITQNDLAEMAGASRPATNRVLHRLAAEGLVILSRGRIRLPRPADLTQVVADGARGQVGARAKHDVVPGVLRGPRARRATERV